MRSARSDYFFIIAMMALWVLTGCQKDTSDQIPVISIQRPYPNQAFGSPDSIKVKATITDDRQILSIRVSLTNENFHSIQLPVFVYPGTTEYELNLTYYIDDKIDVSGSYYIQVRAEDGVNFKNAYQPVVITAPPREFEKALVITRPGYGKVELYELPATGDPVSRFIFDGDYTGGAINSSGGQLFIAGKNQLNLLAFDLKNNTIDWTIDPIPMEPMHNEDCLFFDEYLFATYYTDYIYGYYSYGSVVFDAGVAETESPRKIWRKDNYVLADFQRTNNGQPFIKTMFTLTGQEKQRILTNFSVAGFHHLEGYKLTITANAGSKGMIYRYDIESNGLSFLQELSGNIHSSVEVDNGRILISCDEGLKLFYPQQNILTTLEENLIAKKMSYDDINQLLYTIADNEVRIYSWPQMVNQKTFPFSDTILDLHLQFTK